MKIVRGFTLIEVLVAMLLLALLLAGAWGGIHTATRAIRSGDAVIERMNRLRVTQGFLRRQLSHTLPLSFGQDKSTGVGYVFEGERDFMRFVAPMPGYLSKGGAYVQTLELKGDALQFTDRMLNGYDLDKLEQGSEQDPIVLLNDIGRGHFEYRGLDDQGQLDKWTDQWDQPDRTPVMVRIALDMRADSGITWPTMEIPLMLDIGAMGRNQRSVPVPGFRGQGPTGQRQRAQSPRQPAQMDRGGAR